MMLDVNEIKSSSVSSLKTLFNSVINDIYVKYDYADINLKYEYKYIVENSIEEFKKIFNGIENPIDLFATILDSNLRKYLNKVISNDEIGITIIINFIAKNAVKINSYESAINLLSSLSIFFNNLNYNPSDDICIEIIERSEILSSSLEMVLYNNFDALLSDKINSIFIDKILNKFINLYYSINKENVIMMYPEEFYEKFEKTINSLNCTENGIDDYLKAIDKPLLSKKEEESLFIKFKNGDKRAKKIIIERNLKLVVYVAKNYINKGLPLDEIIQEGNIGLIHATDKFDLSPGYRFSTYAFWEIKKEIARAIDNKSRTVRLPVYVSHEISKYKKIHSNLEQKLGRTPIVSEIANELGVNNQKVVDLMNLEQEIASLDEVISYESNATLADFIEHDGPSTEEIIEKKVLRHNMLELLEKCALTKNEKEVLILRYGIYDNTYKTLEEVGQMFGVTRERIRQIESSALIKIKSSKYTDCLADFTQNPTESLKNIKLFRKENKEYVAKINKKMRKTLSKSNSSSKKIILSNSNNNNSNKPYVQNERQFYNSKYSTIANKIYQRLSKIYTPRETIVICYKLGVMSKEKLSESSIADLLNMNVCEVVNIIKKFSQDYGENFDDLLAINQEKIITKKK